MHSLQAIIYQDIAHARRAKARALRKRQESAQQIIAEKIARSRGIPVNHR
jgi:hypothetical protein